MNRCCKNRHFSEKIIFSFLAFLVIFTSIAPNFIIARAQVEPTWYNQGIGDWFLKVYDPDNPSEIFGERYTAAQVQWVIYGIISYLVNLPFGPKGGALFVCFFGSLGQQNQTLATCVGPALQMLVADNPYTNGSMAAGTDKSLLSLVFATDRPISGISYAKNVVQKFSLVPTVYAQTPGFGFSALSGVRDIWVNSRNIAFGLFVIVAVVFAFMVMFRVKINPQTAISVQSAIPKVIISLILVTFSYAIAGFLIDLMYVVIGLVSLMTADMIPVVQGFLSIQTHTYDPADVFNLLTVGPVNAQSGGAAGGLFGFLMLYMGPLLLIAAIIVFLAIALAVVGAILSVGTLSGFSLIIVLIGFVLVMVLIIVAIWMTIKVFWTFFKALANIILLTIFAPLYLTLGALIPSLSFGQWVKTYVSHLAVFVVSGTMLLLAWIFSLMAWFNVGDPQSLTNLASGTNASPWPPLLGSGGGVVLVYAGVSFVMFTLIPKSAELVQSFISGKPFSYGSGIGEALAPITTGGGAYMDYRSGKELARKESEIKDLERRFADHDPLVDLDMIRKAKEAASTHQVAGGIVKQVLGRR